MRTAKINRSRLQKHAQKCAKKTSIKIVNKPDSARHRSPLIPIRSLHLGKHVVAGHLAAEATRNAAIDRRQA